MLVVREFLSESMPVSQSIPGLMVLPYSPHYYTIMPTALNQ